jgi:hypothetical protein
MGDAHDVRGGSNGAQREPLTKGEPAAEATSATVLALATAADLSRPSTRAPPGDSDLASWDAAARGWEARPAPFRAAYARWRQAEAALARRDRAQAEQALRAAYATATGLGARALQAERGALAGRARIELPTAAPEPAAGEPPPAGTDLGLTARELEVLQHLARGATNRQIADALYISVRTVGVHVSHPRQAQRGQPRGGGGDRPPARTGALARDGVAKGRRPGRRRWPAPSRGQRETAGAGAQPAGSTTGPGVVRPSARGQFRFARVSEWRSAPVQTPARDEQRESGGAVGARLLQ